MRELKDYIDWEKVIAAPRYAGGHQEVMESLFKGRVLASYTEEGYQGTLGYVYQLTQNKIVLVNDYFGSCSYCDSWEDASDETARELINALVNNATVVTSIPKAIGYLKGTLSKAEFYDWKDITEPLIAQLEAIK